MLKGWLEDEKPTSQPEGQQRKRGARGSMGLVHVQSTEGRTGLRQEDGPRAS